MHRQKRHMNTTTRQATAATRRVKPRAAKRGRAASAQPNRAASTKRAAVAQKIAQQRTAELFEQQLPDVWSRFAQECLQFAEGFNTEIGAQQLHVEYNPDSLVAKFAMRGEVLVQLDRERKHVGCFISSQCGDVVSCFVGQPPIGLTIEDDRLHWVYGATAMSADDLAVKLMTELVEMDPAPKSAASR